MFSANLTPAKIEKQIFKILDSEFGKVSLLATLYVEFQFKRINTPIQPIRENLAIELGLDSISTFGAYLGVQYGYL